MIVGRDARGNIVKEGDIILDDRGRAWEVEETERTLRGQRIVRCQSVPLDNRPAPLGVGTVRLELTFRVEKPSSTLGANRRRWERLYDKYARPARRAAAKARQKAAAQPLRPCTVCAKTQQPVRFKIGVAVWKGKKLRVCSTTCANAVRREVTKLQRKHPDIDRERLRRHVAWSYMKEHV